MRALRGGPYAARSALRAKPGLRFAPRFCSMRLGPAFASIAASQACEPIGRPMDSALRNAA